MHNSFLGSFTYVMVPGHLVGLGIRLDVALEVDVVALFNLIGIQGGSHLQTDHGRILTGGVEEREEFDGIGSR